MEQIEQRDTRERQEEALEQQEEARALTDEERESRRQERLLRNRAMIELLDRWSREDAEEQRRTWEAIE